MKISKFFVAVTLFATLSFVFFSCEDNNVEILYYDFDSNTKTASVFAGVEDTGNIVIPSTVMYEGEEYNVTSIGADAFYGCSSLTSITIPESVTEIGDYAFDGCSSLTSIDVASNNNNYTSIGGVLFSKDKTILIKYPGGKKDVTSYTIPEGVTKIEITAFWGCSSLTSVTIPSSVTSIGADAFWGCSSLTSITIPEGVTAIANGAFYHCSSLTSITLPESVTSIGFGAFAGCSSLTSITIPEGVTEIGERAFYYCSSLTSITLPSSVIEIEGYFAFDGCSSLTSIDVASNNNNYTSIGGVLFSKDKTILIQYPEGKDATSYTILEGVTEIGYGAFDGCSSLTSITIPESVTEIGDLAFYYCSSLTSITILEGVTSIGSYAFDGCSSLTSITIPEGVTTIGGSAFDGCRSLTSITCKNTTPPTLSEYKGEDFTFEYVDKSIPLYVPAESVEVYKKTKYWKDFYYIQAIP